MARIMVLEGMKMQDMDEKKSPLLQAEGLCLRRGGRLLFEDLDFRLAPGEALLVTGRNGAGKSSLLRLLAGLLEADDGLLHNPFATALLGSEPALKPDQTVRQELAFWAAIDGASVASVEQAATAMAVAPLQDFPCRTLSSGQRQRVAIARTMASGADLWLLDEPTNALDSTAQQWLLQAIAAHRAGGGLVIAATHQPLPLPEAQELRLGD